jgi:hypothetical protein
MYMTVFIVVMHLYEIQLSFSLLITCYANVSHLRQQVQFLYQYVDLKLIVILVWAVISLTLTHWSQTVLRPGPQYGQRHDSRALLYIHTPAPDVYTRRYLLPVRWPSPTLYILLSHLINISQSEKICSEKYKLWNRFVIHRSNNSHN